MIQNIISIVFGVIIAFQAIDDHIARLSIQIEMDICDWYFG